VKPERPIVLYVGRFFEQKGFDILPELFAVLKGRHPDVSFKVIGTGPLREAVCRQFEERGLMDCLTLHEFSSQDKVLSLYREAAAVVMPSRHEPFGLVATETMATATPLVASKVGGLKEILNHEEDGFLVAPDDIAGFANTLSRLLADRELARAVGERARESVVKKYAQGVCFEKTRAAYRDTIQKNRGTAWAGDLRHE
jgi:glycogen(starch) synthase